VKARPAPPLDPLPVMKQFETFEYNPEGLRDPFAVPVPDRDSGSGLRPDPNRRKEALEVFPLDGLNMVGTIGTGANLIGLVLAPDRVTYRVRPGMYMGQNDGRITAVTRTASRWSSWFRMGRVAGWSGKPRSPLKTMIDWGIA
jgi:type IV pilus assembly protein PilP